MSITSVVICDGCKQPISKQYDKETAFSIGAFAGGTIHFVIYTDKGSLGATNLDFHNVDCFQIFLLQEVNSSTTGKKVLKEDITND
jgi:hypothetical protein